MARHFRVACLVAVLVCCAAFVLVSQGRAQGGGSWVGKHILTKKSGVQIVFSVGKDERKGVATLTDLTYLVEEEKGGFVQVCHRGVVGWLPKEDALSLDDAVAFFTAQIRKDNMDARAYACRARALREKGEYDSALKDSSEAIRLQPAEPAWHVIRGNVLADKKEHIKAIAEYDEAVQLSSDRGLDWFLKGEYDKSLDDFDQVIRLRPKSFGAFLNRGQVWQAKKEHGKALADFDEALRLAPKEAAVFPGRAWLLATCPDGKYRDGKKAVQSARRACELTEWKEPTCLDALAAACAEAGDFQQAVKYQQQALDFPEHAKVIGDKARERLKLYEAGKPFRAE